MPIVAFALKYWRTLALLAALAAAWLLYLYWQDTQREIGREEVRAEWQAATNAAKNRVEELEEAARTKADAQTLKDAQNEKTIAGLTDKLRAAGRMRDPYATPCRSVPQGPASPADSAADGTQSAGLLSEQFSEMLREWAREADAINIAYTSAREALGTCRALLAE